ncbi:MAG: cytosolic protein [Blastocatellia bacterium]|nr:cytosolic protein [Blastocatellia bacterium]
MTETAVESLSVSEAAWEAIQGAYDLQVHVAPDVIERRIDDLDLAKEFLAHGLKGFVLKSHYIPTAERAAVVTKAVPGIEAYGAITLNHSVGGLNPVALEIAGRSGNKIVWFPTVDAANETAGRLDGGSDKLPFWAKIQREIAAAGITRPPMTVLDTVGNISEDAQQCLELIAKHDMILATGHLGRHEIFPLVRAAKGCGVQRIIVTHAEFPSQNLTAEEQIELADAGAIIEHCFTTYHTNKCTWETVFANIRAVGVERTMLATDLGQKTNPPVAAGFAEFAQRLLDAGFTGQEINHMAATIPARLIH